MIYYKLFWNKNTTFNIQIFQCDTHLSSHLLFVFSSVRDLLRALRNKKHHYNELPEVTKLMYGRLPDQFTDYWTSRFPKLLIHSWMAMHCIKNEPSFAKYFDKDYDFVKV